VVQKITFAKTVSLLFLGFAGVAQLFPGVVLGLYSGRVSTPGVFAGMAVGISLAMFLMLTGRDPYYGVNAGFVALCCNFVVTAVISLLRPPHIAAFDETLPILATSQSGDNASSV
jgi:SSS family solute:Na+ symporter